MACFGGNKKSLLCYLTDKAFRSLYTLLLVVLMTLWIVMSVESGRQLQELQALRGNHGASGSQGGGGLNRLKPEDARRLAGSLASAAIITTATRSSLSRLYGLTVFNTLLEEAIALGALLSLFTRSRKLFGATLTLLTIIWFIEQYRISDFYHQIDHLEYQAAQVLIATHVLHFLVILVGFFLLLLTGNETVVKLCKQNTDTSANDTEKGSSQETLDTPLKSSSLKAFADLENNIQNSENGAEPPRKSRCAWMRKTFVKVQGRNNPQMTKEEDEEEEEKEEVAVQNKRVNKRTKSQVTIISAVSSKLNGVTEKAENLQEEVSNGKI